jgi:hypothetical protein
MAKFTTIAKLVGATDMETYNNLLAAVPPFIHAWIETFRVSKKYKSPKAHIFVGNGLSTSDVNKLVQGWVNDRVANVIDLGNGKYSVELKHQEAIEKLILKRGMQINEDGRKLEVLIPPMEISMTDILEMVAEKLEVQDEKDADDNRRGSRQPQRRVSAAQSSDDKKADLPKPSSNSRDVSNSPKSSSPFAKRNSRENSPSKASESQREHATSYVPPSQPYRPPSYSQPKGGKGFGGYGYNQGKGFGSGFDQGKGAYYQGYGYGKGAFSQNYDQSKGKGKGKGGKGESVPTGRWTGHPPPKPPAQSVPVASSTAQNPK